jgi:hypothetical protein
MGSDLPFLGCVTPTAVKRTFCNGRIELPETLINHKFIIWTCVYIIIQYLCIIAVPLFRLSANLKIEKPINPTARILRYQSDYVVKIFQRHFTVQKARDNRDHGLCFYLMIFHSFLRLAST